jgi:RNA polymerase sigma-70 factor (ECF subfamily)
MSMYESEANERAPHGARLRSRLAPRRGRTTVVRVRSDVGRAESRPAADVRAAAPGPDFEEAWQAHGRAVFERCLFLMAGRREDADEAFSRASFTAFQKYAVHRRRIQNVRHWLLRLAHNVCMDLYRERARQSRLCDLEPVDSEAPVAVDARHRPVDPEASLLAAEQIAVLHAAVARLAPRLRGPLELRLRDELSDRAIAARLHLTEASVRKRLQEARAALKPALLAYRGDFRGAALTNTARATSVQREPERLTAPAGERTGRPARPDAHARASAIAERR